MPGTIYEPNTLFFRNEVGTIRDQKTGQEYELTTDFGTGVPIIRSIATGRWFSLKWDEMLLMAREAGIDAPVTKETPL